MKRAHGRIFRLLSAVLVMTFIVSLLPVEAGALSYTGSSSYRSGVYYQRLTAVSLTGNQRTDIVNVARSQVGYFEGNNSSQLSGTSNGSGNYTEYGRWYGMQDLWCAMFVSWCANVAGVSTSVVPSHAFTPSGLSWFMQKGRAFSRATVAGGGYTPQPGDIIYFKSSRNTNTTNHVGIVTGYSGGTVYTIEGNTSSATISTNGGCVAAKSYSISNTYIVYICSPNYVVPPPRVMKYEFVTQVGIPMEKSNTAYYKFMYGDYNRDGVQDMYVVKKQGASSTEVHVLNGNGAYQSFLLHAATVLHKTDAGWDFALGDYNGDTILDLYAIARSGGSGKTEVHVLNGSNNFQTFLLHASTVLGTTSDTNNFRFAVADYNGDGKPDLYMIKKQGVSSTEIHVLNGANNFRSFLLQTGTVLGKTGSDWEFGVGNYNSDGKPDVYCICKTGASGSTEVHVLNGSGNYQSFLLQTASALHKTDGSFTFAIKNNSNVCAIAMQAKSCTELHEMAYK